MKDLQPTVWFSVPSVAILMQRMRLLKDDLFPWIRLSFFCGEAFPLEVAQAWKKAAPASSIVNLYGPTETTIAVSSYVLPKETFNIKSHSGIVSIGNIFPGHKYLKGLDEFSVSTLYISGPQVVSGYFRDHLQTGEKFFRMGDPWEWYYNTGDLVEEDDEGDLFFLGREDSEVKISGYRVNLQEIDHVLASYTSVQQAVTLYLSSGSATNVLVAFIISEKKDEDTISILDHCRQRLPVYMVPEKIIFVKAMPLNPNGKVDRPALAGIFTKQDE